MDSYINWNEVNLSWWQENWNHFSLRVTLLQACGIKDLKVSWKCKDLGTLFLKLARNLDLRRTFPVKHARLWGHIFFLSLAEEVSKSDDL